MSVVENDEKGHIDRVPDYEEKRQKEVEKLDYYFIRINHDKLGFDDYKEFGRISSYITKSIKKQPKKIN